MFYFCINVGSLCSTIITPILRTQVSYAVAFGVPAGLLTIATVIFWLGRNTYIKVPPAGSIVSESCKVLFQATKGYLSPHHGEARRPFFDYGMESVARLWER